ncbi:hypothetical protein NA78x_003137 [Anatilimnocola sp. NA78]|uniref:hypothetical protein n=1 Tax=Anatilimnocola sp. NA78 TaxID=3415683 RepID=UPI003CE5829E
MNDAPGDNPIDDALIDEVLGLLKAGQKLQAVARLREALDLSLLDAKQLADSLEAVRLPSVAEKVPLSAGWQSEAVSLLQKGQKMHAIKLCRAYTGCSLSEAKEQVERLAAEQGIAPPRGAGCAGVFLSLIALAFVLGSFAWYVG